MVVIRQLDPHRGTSLDLGSSHLISTLLLLLHINLNLNNSKILLHRRLTQVRYPLMLSHQDMCRPVKVHRLDILVSR